jgi:hypothetical protein
MSASSKTTHLTHRARFIVTPIVAVAMHAHAACATHNARTWEWNIHVGHGKR